MFSLAAAALFALLSWAITVFYRGLSFFSLFTEGRPFAAQLLVGLVLGVAVAGLIAALLLRGRPFASLRAFLTGILASLRPTKLDIVTCPLAARSEERPPAGRT